MSLLQQIQDDAASNVVPVSVVLRKCKILAARLKNRSFAEWVESEISGYQPEKDLPEYRIFSKPEIRGDFYGPFNTASLNCPVPSRCLPESIQELENTDIKLKDGCAYWESLFDDSGRSGDPFRLYWPNNVIAILANYQLGVCPGMQCLHLWWVLPRGIIVNLLDNVRNKILSFALEIESENPEAGEVMGNKPPIEDSRVQQIFNQHFHGAVGNVAAGGQNFNQSATVGPFLTQQNLNIDALRQELPRFVQVLRAEASSSEQYAALTEVSKVADEVEKPEAEQSPSKIIEGLSKAGKWAFDVATKIGTTVIADQIKQGIPHHGM